MQPKIRLTGVLLGAVAVVLMSAFVGEAAVRKLTLWAPVEPQFKAVCDKFMKENPGVKVNLTTGDQDKFYTMITAGLMPDLWGPWGTPGIRADVNRNWIVDLTPYIKRDGKAMDIDDFFPGIMRQFRVAGKQYSLPIFSYAEYYYYNTKLYSQSGLTPPPMDANDRSWDWDRMVSDAKKLTRRSGNGTITTAGAEVGTGIDDPNFMHIWGASEYGDEALKTAVPQEVHWTDSKSVTALTKAWELVNKYKVAKNTDWNFESGKAAGSLAGGPMVNYYVASKSLKWAIAPLPWGETNSGTLWPDGWRIGRMCKDKELAWSFIKFMCRPDNMKYIVADPKSSRQGSPAARKSVFKETLGKVIGKATGMDPQDVFRVHSDMDEVGKVKYQELICIHSDLVPFWGPIFASMLNNRVSPEQCAQKLQEVSNRQMPLLFKRWIRNIKFTGAE